jgi:hypothetical protein
VPLGALAVGNNVVVNLANANVLDKNALEEPVGDSAGDAVRWCSMAKVEVAIRIASRPLCNNRKVRCLDILDDSCSYSKEGCKHFPRKIEACYTSGGIAGVRIHPERALGTLF